MRLAFLALVPLVAGCGELDDIDAGVCGNGVLEKGEDCDSSDPSCSPPGAELECRYIAVNGVCPPGGAAVPSVEGGDEVCRFASGDYESSSFLSTGPSFLVGLADFDGDFALDPVGLGPGELSVHFHDREAHSVGTAKVSTSFVFPALGSLSQPPPADTGEGPAPARASLASANLGVSVTLGRPGRTLQQKSYAPYLVDDNVLNVIFAEVNPLLPGDEVLALVSQPGSLEIQEIYAQATPTKAVAVGSPASTSVAVGNVDDSFCDELLVAEQGNPEIWLMPTCEGLVPKPDLPHKTLKLPAGMTVSSEARFADLNADGKLDVIVQGQSVKETRLLVATNMGFNKFVSPTSVVDELGPLFPEGMALVDNALPLAVGQLNGDGKPDFVTGYVFVPEPNNAGNFIAVPPHIVLSGAAVWPTTCAAWEEALKLLPGTLVKPSYHCGDYGYWTTALITHVNGDGYPDIAASVEGTPLVQALLGTPVPGIFNPAEIPAQGSAVDLITGDFDGDSVPDLAFVEMGSTENTVAVAFGRVAGPPESPVRLSGLGNVTALRGGYIFAFPQSFDLVGDLGVMTAEAGGVRHAALLHGGTNRTFQAPFQIMSGAGQEQTYHPAVRALIGEFAQENETAGKHGDLAVLTNSEVSGGGSTSGGTQLWLLPSSGEANLDNSLKFASDPLGSFHACAAAMTPADLDGDGSDEIVMLGEEGSKPTAHTMRIARRKPGAGFELGSAAPLEEWYVDALNASRCGLLGDQAVGDLGLLLSRPPRAVDLSGRTGPEARPDIVSLAVIGEKIKEGFPMVAIFPNDGAGGLDPSKRLLVQLPDELADRVIIAFDLLNADADPQKEIVFATAELDAEAYGETFLADIDLATGKLALIGRLQGPSEVLSIAAGDIDRDGVDDIVLSGMWGVEVLRGLPRAP